ncbi:MAG: alpha/beta fold hydrolase [Myxococcota bacterium]
MPTVEASDGAKLHYEESGSGTPLLLCNASFATHAHWSAQLEPLARHFHVIVWDYRGHGRSEAPADDRRYSLAQVVDDLRVLHREIAGGTPAAVAGLSLGGLVALSFALAHPERVRALLLLNTGPGFKNPAARKRWEEGLERAAARLEEVGMARYLEGRRATAELLGRAPDADAARRAREGMLCSDVAGLARFARQVAGPVPNLVDRLAEVRPPCLILVGEHDAAFQRAGEVLEAKLPHATRRILPGAGHVLNLDQPEAFVRAVEEFLGAQGVL